MLSLVLIVMFFELHLRPQISEYAASEVKKNINLNINRIIGSEIADGNVTYEKLVTVQKDADNHITSISTNIDKMNALKVRVESSILENLMTEEKTTINIPLGSLIGGFFLSGRGPSFKVKVIPTTDVYASFDNSFVSAGINQTRHKIMMNFKVRIG
ncbi:MAG: sporulation protein YunB, partial [Clostridia bacterium]